VVAAAAGQSPELVFFFFLLFLFVFLPFTCWVLSLRFTAAALVT